MDFSKYLALGLISVSILGCPAPEEAPVSCGNGEIHAYEGEAFCLYRKEIQETGFTCPSEVPYFRRVDDIIVCSNLRVVINKAARLNLFLKDIPVSLPWNTLR